MNLCLDLYGLNVPVCLRRKVEGGGGAFRNRGGEVKIETGGRGA